MNINFKISYLDVRRESISGQCDVALCTFSQTGLNYPSNTECQDS